MNMLLIYLFASMTLEKGYKKNYLALVLKLRYITIFCEILTYLLTHSTVQSPS